MNKVFLIGRLVKEADLRYTKNGKAVAVFTIAVNRNKEQTDFIRITAFNKTAENVANYLQKGSLVAIDGTIVTGSYEKNGQRIYTTDIWADTVQFLSRPEGSNSADKQQGKGKGSAQKKDAYTGAREAFSKPPEMEWGNDDPFGGEPVEFNDDDLPF
ncbi:single-stranded DNA-binding protein [Geobacillus subterraneus]|uniref:Single-stranded DNA-binding protein n=1 Tax=Geobacillus subterraneus TaxID=129338 RepID=A0A679FWG3_9BACL|nr:single-stranded DNA-binding protein [Geobacillus subterraneus]BBW99035.1 single-stranded DNA-binding protein [Geobacillus subterraneus]